MKTKTETTAYIVHSIAVAVLVLTAQISLAGSAIWLSTPPRLRLGKSEQLE
jgi:hypothetical protein